MSNVLRNILYNAVAKVLIISAQFAATTILAWKLSADDYGVVGFATVLVSFFATIGSLGLSTALIQRPSLTEQALSTAAILNIIVSVAAFGSLQLVAPLAGHLLNNEASIQVVRVLAFGFLLNPLGFLASCLLVREIRFAELRGPTIAGAVVRGGTAIAMAHAGLKYWSLVFGTLAGSLIQNVLLQFLQPTRHHWKFDTSEARKLLRFGIPYSLGSVATFAALNTDNLAIGSTLGSVALGYYAIAYNWGTFVCTGLQEIVHTVLQPKFARLQDDLAGMREGFIRTLRLSSFLATLINTGLFVVATLFLVHVLGKGTDRWLPATHILEILCVYGAVRATTVPIGNPIVATGETKVLLKANLLAAIAEIALLPFIARHFGILAVGCWVVIAYSLQWFFFLPFVSRRLQISPRVLFQVIAPIMIAAVSAGVAGRLLPKLTEVWWLEMSARLATVVVVFSAVHEALSHGAILAEVRGVYHQLQLRRSK